MKVLMICDIIAHWLNKLSYCFLLIETKSNLLQLFLIKAVYFLEENFFFQLITYMEKEHLPHVIYICFFFKYNNNVLFITVF